MPDAPYVFVSYASVDREQVLPIVERLTACGASVWIDREGIHGGATYGVEITEAIEHASALLLFCSPASLASRNVRQEIALGWRFEKPYVPLLLEPVEIPKEVAYWLEGCQWIELLDHADTLWLPSIVQALEHYGITVRPPAGTSTPPLVTREPTLLIGREREQGVLSARLERMLAGRGGVVLVGGEAGIGKTTLVEDLGLQAEAQGGLVLWGHAYDLSVTSPYGPWREILRQYQSLDGELPPSPTLLGSTEELAKADNQETLFAAGADFFRAVAAQLPLVLVLDDLHWFDQASLDFLRYLARQVTDQRLLLVATYRDDELRRGHPLFALLPLLVREAGAERVAVQRLDQLGHRAMIESRYTLAEDDRLRLERYLTERAEGNPLYAGELLRALEEEHVLVQQSDGWVLLDLEHARVPALLRQVIEGRVARFDEESQRLLGVAAVIGQTIRLEIWQATGEVDEDTLLDLAERAEEARILDAISTGDGVQFGHALIREALYESIPVMRRRRLHRMVGELLAATSSPEPDTVAYHFERAGDVRAIEWLIQAGERAAAIHAPDTAIEQFNLAESMATRHAQALPTSVYRARGQANSLVGNFEAARADFETILTQARRDGDQSAEWQALVELGMLWASRDYAETGNYFQQALSLAQAMGNPSLTASSLNRIGNWHVNVERPLEALRYHQDALAIFEQLDDRAGIAATADLLGLASYLSGDLVQGTGYYRRAIALFRAADNRQGLSSSLAVMSMRCGTYMTDTMVADRATPAECSREAEEAAEIARTIGWRAGEAFALAMVSRCRASAGEYQEALAAVERSIEIAQGIGHRQWLASAHCAAGTALLDLLALPEAQHHLEAAVRFARSTASRHWINCTCGVLASALVEDGNKAGAGGVLDTVLTPDTPMQSMGQRLAWSARVELALARGEAEEALRLLDRMLESAPNASAAQPVLRYSMLRAEALAALNRLDEAETALRAALTVADSHQGLPWAWRIHLALGKLYSRVSEPERAATELAAARTIVHELAAEIRDDSLRQAFLEGAARMIDAP